MRLKFCSKSMKMVFVESTIRHKLCMIYELFDFFLFKNNFWPKGISLLLSLTTWGPLYTYLVHSGTLPWLSVDSDILLLSKVNESRKEDAKDTFNNLGPPYPKCYYTKVWSIVFLASIMCFHGRGTITLPYKFFNSCSLVAEIFLIYIWCFNLYRKSISFIYLVFC